MLQDDFIIGENTGNVFKMLSQQIKLVYEEVIYDCNEFDFIFTQQSHYNTHIKSVYEKVYYSSYFNSIFTHQGLFITHIMMVP